MNLIKSLEIIDGALGDRALPPDVAAVVTPWTSRERRAPARHFVATIVQDQREKA